MHRGEKAYRGIFYLFLALSLLLFACSGSEQAGPTNFSLSLPAGQTIAPGHLLVMLVTADEDPTGEVLLLEDCGDNLPLMGNRPDALVERIRIAVLKLSEGDLDRLEAAIRTAAIDWRDTLVAAGFAHDVQAHLAWEPDS